MREQVERPSTRRNLQEEEEKRSNLDENRCATSSQRVNEIIELTGRLARLLDQIIQALCCGETRLFAICVQFQQFHSFFLLFASRFVLLDFLPDGVRRSTRKSLRRFAFEGVRLFSFGEFRRDERRRLEFRSAVKTEFRRRASEFLRRRSRSKENVMFQRAFPEVFALFLVVTPKHEDEIALNFRLMIVVFQHDDRQFVPMEIDSRHFWPKENLSRDVSSLLLDLPNEQTDFHIVLEDENSRRSQAEFIFETVFAHHCM